MSADTSWVPTGGTVDTVEVKIQVCEKEIALILGAFFYWYQEDTSIMLAETEEAYPPFSAGLGYS